ncbi:MAG: hydantoin racemase [Pseudonocardia sp.]|nr:hydantoin racemase [Pseudonocardia sp.]
MRIYAVTPIHVDGPELIRRQARYDALSPAGVEVVLHDIGPDAPRALETAEQIRASEVLVGRALADVPREFDATLPDCVLDPGVPAPGVPAPGEPEPGRPKLGLLRAGLGSAVMAGARTAAVARNRAIADELEARVRAYGWSDTFCGVTVLDLAVSDIEDPVRWARAVRPALDRAKDAGASVVLNGCSAVDVGPDEDGLPTLLDPIAAGLAAIARS